MAQPRSLTLRQYFSDHFFFARFLFLLLFIYFLVNLIFREFFAIFSRLIKGIAANWWGEKLWFLNSKNLNSNVIRSFLGLSQINFLCFFRLALNSKTPLDSALNKATSAFYGTSRTFEHANIWVVLPWVISDFSFNTIDSIYQHGFLAVSLLLRPF